METRIILAAILVTVGFFGGAELQSFLAGVSWTSFPSSSEWESGSREIDPNKHEKDKDKKMLGELREEHDIKARYLIRRRLIAEFKDAGMEFDERVFRETASNDS